MDCNKKTIVIKYDKNTTKYSPKSEGSCVALFAQSWIEIPPMEGLTLKVGLDVSIPIGFMGHIFGTTDLGRHGVLFNNTVIPNVGMYHIFINLFNPSKDVVYIAEGEKIAYFAISEVQPIRLRNKISRRGKNEKKSNSIDRENGKWQDNNQEPNITTLGEIRIYSDND